MKTIKITFNYSIELQYFDNSPLGNFSSITYWHKEDKEQIHYKMRLSVFNYLNYRTHKINCKNIIKYF